MALTSPSNPLGYIINRQYNDKIIIKNKIFKERLIKARNLFRKDLLAHYGCVNAIEFSDEGDLLVSGGDDRRVLLWTVPEAIHGKGAPIVMDTNHYSNIFCLAFDSMNTKIYSGGNDDQVLLHDTNSGNLIGKLAHGKPVYGLSVNPQNDNLLATAGDDGRILIFDIRESGIDSLCLAKQKTGFHSVKFNPCNPRWLVTANSEEGIALWDSRKPKEVLLHYDKNAGTISGISASFNTNGTKVLALRRRLPPVLYNTQEESAICQFYHPQYYNSCTMKTCCFAGDNDEYILSGSDDFNLYMWRMPENDSTEWGTSHLVLRGHRSIVNQVRYSKSNNLIASSGVEKMIKLWSTMPIGTWSGSLQKEQTDPSRLVYSHEDYIYLVGQTGERISHDYSDHSTQEDCKMMAFFDSLIQREIEGWDSLSDNNNSTTSDSDSDGDHYYNLLNKMYSNSNKSSIKQEEKEVKLTRIDRLIAKKRLRLIRLAYKKSSTSVLKYSMKEQNRKQSKKNSQKQHQKQQSTKFKKNNGLNKKSLSNKHIINDNNNNNNNNRKHHKFQIEQQRHKIRKYRTRQSLREMCDNNNQIDNQLSSSNNNNNNLYDAPSTSTGITSSNNTIYRVIEQDSDEDIPPNNNNNNNNSNNNNNCIETNRDDEGNFVNILPTPLNGTHDMYINVLEMTNNNNNNNVVTVRNEDYNRASTSNATISNGSNSNNNNNTRDCTNNNNNNEFYENNNNICASTSSTHLDNNNYMNDSESDIDYDYQYHHTPLKKRRTISVSDSGCGTGPCSSTSPYNIRRNQQHHHHHHHHQECSSNNNNHNNNNDLSSDDEFNYEKFKKRVDKARINIRKQIGADSDSN